MARKSLRAGGSSRQSGPGYDILNKSHKCACTNTRVHTAPPHPPPSGLGPGWETKLSTEVGVAWRLQSILRSSCRCLGRTRGGAETTMREVTDSAGLPSPLLASQPNAGPTHSTPPTPLLPSVLSPASSLPSPPLSPFSPAFLPPVFPFPLPSLLPLPHHRQGVLSTPPPAVHALEKRHNTVPRTKEGGCLSLTAPG